MSNNAIRFDVVELPSGESLKSESIPADNSPVFQLRALNAKLAELKQEFADRKGGVEISYALPNNSCVTWFLCDDGYWSVSAKYAYEHCSGYRKVWTNN